MTFMHSGDYRYLLMILLIHRANFHNKGNCYAVLGFGCLPYVVPDPLPVVISLNMYFDMQLTQPYVMPLSSLPCKTSPQGPRARGVQNRLPEISKGSILSNTDWPVVQGIYVGKISRNKCGLIDVWTLEGRDD